MRSSPECRDRSIATDPLTCAEIRFLGQPLTTIHVVCVPVDPDLPMSPTPSSHVSDQEPGQLLKELEQRQDEVLQQLDDLDEKLREVLQGLGVSVDDEVDPGLV